MRPLDVYRLTTLSFSAHRIRGARPALTAQMQTLLEKPL
jgi:hypothetical protein